MDYWSASFGCQADDYYESLKSLLAAQGEISGADAARFLNCDLELIQPLLVRLVEEGVAVTAGHLYRRRPEGG